MLWDINWTKIEHLSIWHLYFQHWDTINTLNLQTTLNLKLQKRGGKLYHEIQFHSYEKVFTSGTYFVFHFLNCVEGLMRKYFSWQLYSFLEQPFSKRWILYDQHRRFWSKIKEKHAKAWSNAVLFQFIFFPHTDQPVCPFLC